MGWAIETESDNLNETYQKLMFTVDRFARMGIY